MAFGLGYDRIIEQMEYHCFSSTLHIPNKSNHIGFEETTFFFRFPCQVVLDPQHTSLYMSVAKGPKKGLDWGRNDEKKNTRITKFQDEEMYIRKKRKLIGDEKMCQNLEGMCRNFKECTKI